MNSFSPDLGPATGVTARLIEGARDKAPVTGLPHAFYRYPARFSPAFVRGAIETYTEAGDWVFDPFVGGGTTLVEAMALGRNALGIDISSLSSFLCDAKTQILEEQDIAVVRRWMGCIENTINMHAPGQRYDDYADAGYYRHLQGPGFWRLRKAIEQALGSVDLPWDSTLDDEDGRLWRDVPDRRWHAHQKSHAPGAREVVLVHKKAGA